MPDDSTCIMLLLFQRGSLSKNLNLNGFSSIKKCLLWERDIYVCVWVLFICICFPGGSEVKNPYAIWEI